MSVFYAFSAKNQNSVCAMKTNVKKENKRKINRDVEKSQDKHRPVKNGGREGTEECARAFTVKRSFSN